MLQIWITQCMWTQNSAGLFQVPVLNEVGWRTGKVTQSDKKKSNYSNSYYNGRIEYHHCCIKQKTTKCLGSHKKSYSKHDYTLKFCAVISAYVWLPFMIVPGLFRSLTWVFKNNTANPISMSWQSSNGCRTESSLCLKTPTSNSWLYSTG